MGKFFVILTENSTKWSPISFSDMFNQHLSKEGDVWDSMNIVNHELIPTDIYSYDGIVITGSRFNCRDQLTWMEPLCTLIQNISQRGKPNLFGGCFGCQIIAFALGGKIDYNPTHRFVLKWESINLDLEKLHQICPVSIPLPPVLRIICSHGDCVRELPDGVAWIGTSPSCVHEIFVAGRNNNILACQSHPEFTYEYAIEERIWPQVVNISKRLTEEEAAISKASFEGVNREDSDQFCLFISSFLRRHFDTPLETTLI